jgi:hypothetical protein
VTEKMNNQTRISTNEIHTGRDRSSRGHDSALNPPFQPCGRAGSYFSNPWNAPASRRWLFSLSFRFNPVESGGTGGLRINEACGL